MCLVQIVNERHLVSFKWKLYLETIFYGATGTVFYDKIFNAWTCFVFSIDENVSFQAFKRNWSTFFYQILNCEKSVILEW